MGRDVADIDFDDLTSPKLTDFGSGARSSAKSERWSNAQISRNPSSLATRCRPRNLPGSIFGAVVGRADTIISIL